VSSIPTEARMLEVLADYEATKPVPVAAEPVAVTA
jgi:hypothetical protein